MRLNLRVALLLLIGLVAIGGLWSANQTSAPSSEGPGAKSATLVIDFGAAAERQTKVVKLRNLSDEETGWSLFEVAGVEVQGTAQYSVGFVCRLDGWPAEEDQDCTRTPTAAEGHWAYYVTNSKMGAGWILSGQGAASHNPECGGYEGWVWVTSGQRSKPPRFDAVVQKCD